MFFEMEPRERWLKYRDERASHKSILGRLFFSLTRDLSWRDFDHFDGDPAFRIARSLNIAIDVTVRVMYAN